MAIQQAECCRSAETNAERLSGVRHGSTVNFSCSVSASPRPPYRGTCPHQADGQHSHGGPFFAIKPVRSASIPRIAAIGVGLWRGRGHQQFARNARRVSLRSAQCERAAMHRVHRLAAVSGGPQKARSNRLQTSVSVRSPPYEARASPTPRSRATQDVTFGVDPVLRRHSRSGGRW